MLKTCLITPVQEALYESTYSEQGEDYHYYYTPMCLMDKHNLDLPMAFGLNGIIFIDSSPSR